jgi:hypothetical protein
MSLLVVVYAVSKINKVQMYVCIRSNTTQGSLYYNVLIILKLHVSAFFFIGPSSGLHVRRCFLYKYV